MLVFVRSISGTVATLLVTLFASIIALGIEGHVDMVLSALITSSPVIILTVTDCVHI